jgi:histidinol-phosphate phosphatase family protein
VNRRRGRAAVFIDKDGTLLEDVAYNTDPKLMRFTPGAVKALKLLKKLGYPFIIVTNQPGVARGVMTLEDVARGAGCLAGILAKEGVPFNGFYFCPHDPRGRVPAYSKRCLCRKPGPGLLQRAAADNGLDLARSWLVGDILDDIEAGKAAGCRTILLDRGTETLWELNRKRMPGHIVRNLYEAAVIISVLGDRCVRQKYLRK